MTRQELKKEAVDILANKFPPETFGEDEDCARLEQIIGELASDGVSAHVSVCFPADIDETFPTIDVLEKLTEAAEILLHQKDYDGHGWEIIATCVDRAKEIREKYYKR